MFKSSEIPEVEEIIIIEKNALQNIPICDGWKCGLPETHFINKKYNYVS